MVVFCTIYSTFLQHAYDQLIHDVCLQNLPVIFCVDRAGLVGEDGSTHHGVFDIAFLRCIPNLIIYAPKDEQDLRDILYTASLGLNHPIAIRYPRGNGKYLNFREKITENNFQKIEIGKSHLLKKGSKIAVLSTGFIGNNVTLALEKITNKETIAHYDFGFIKPLDENNLHTIFEKFEIIITIEDGCISGGFGSSVLEFSNQYKYSKNILRLGIPDTFIEQGTVDELQEICKIDVSSLVELFNILIHAENI